MCKKGLKTTELFNVCYNLEDKETLLREISALVEAMRYFKLKESKIIIDVEEVGKVSALGYTGRYRPALGGVSIGHYKITAGTFGCLVKDRKTNRTFILSNNHVLANSNKAKRGDIILQPAPFDGGKAPKDLLGYLEKWVEIGFGKKNSNLIV